MSNYQGEGNSQLDFDEFYSEVLTSLVRRPDVISSDNTIRKSAIFQEINSGRSSFEKVDKKNKK